MRKRKIAILGGGLGALSAAYELTEQPNWSHKYELTVYQVGWRLGGKAASGRNQREGFGQRTEEHGIHVFFGFYENAFYLLRRCYAALRRDKDSPLGTWNKAFIPRDAVVWAEREPEHSARRWTFWGVGYPRRGGQPGDLAQRLRNPSRVPGRRVRHPSIRRLLFAWLHTGLQQMFESRFGPPLWMRALLLVMALGVGLLRDFGARLLLPLEAVLVRRCVAGLDGRIDDPHARHLWMELRLALVVLGGLIKDDVIDRGFDRLDHLEFGDWLRTHGATDDLLASPFLQSAYDSVFAFDVDADGRLVPAMAAGTALRSVLRAFSYRHAAVWKMRAGMGDVVVMPLYEVLRRRGVKFEFFHRVTQLEPSFSGASIERIRVVPQVRLADAQEPYQPIVTVNDHINAWTSEPDLKQLADGDALRAALVARPFGLECPPWITDFEHDEICLERGKDFDDVVLGISVGGLAEITQGLAHCSERWARMLDKVATTPTQAFQLWLKAR